MFCHLAQFQIQSMPQAPNNKGLTYQTPISPLAREKHTNTYNGAHAKPALKPQQLTDNKSYIYRSWALFHGTGNGRFSPFVVPQSAILK